MDSGQVDSGFFTRTFHYNPTFPPQKEVFGLDVVFFGEYSHFLGVLVALSSSFRFLCIAIPYKILYSESEQALSKNRRDEKLSLANPILRVKMFFVQ